MIISLPQDLIAIATKYQNRMGNNDVEKVQKDLVRTEQEELSSAPCVAGCCVPGCCVQSSRVTREPDSSCSTPSHAFAPRLRSQDLFFSQVLKNYGRMENNSVLRALAALAEDLVSALSTHMMNHNSL